VPFKPTQGRPVLCRQCFQAKRPAGEAAHAAAATADLMATTTNAEMVSAEMMAAAAQAPQA
jgi:hypothetical protein